MSFYLKTVPETPLDLLGRALCHNMSYTDVKIYFNRLKDTQQEQYLLASLAASATIP